MKTPKTKICTKCGEEKALDAFEPRRKMCRGCRNRDLREKRRNNTELHETLNEQSRQYYWTHREQCIEQNRIYRLKNLEKTKETEKRWRKTNAKRFKETARQWYEANIESCRARSRMFQREVVQRLSDYYVKGLICDNTSLKSKDISDEMVKIRRTILKFKRHLKEKQNDKSRNQSIGKESRRRMG